MNKFSDQDEKEIMFFIRDWLKIHGYSQKDFASKLNISSGRSSEILKKIKELYKKGGIYNIAQKLIKIEQSWLDKNQFDNHIEIKKEDNPYSQLDINYKVDIDALVERMEKDHQLRKK
tara:strand:+ start:520 stop:873 length:354 start_codon:yes stop_codon:yes gene_type:complete